ncbi:MAG: hypothetical protein WC900_09590 [Oscillospiraceae bacterium]|jgi:hypothetical protein
MKFGIPADIRRSGMYGSSTDYSIVKVQKPPHTFKAKKTRGICIEKSSFTFKAKKRGGWKPKI